MVDFLSDDWIAALDEAARTVKGDEDFVIQQVVDDEPPTHWYIVLSPGPVRIHPGEAETADVTFTQDRATAEAIARGELSAGAALTSGRLTVRGASARLTEQREVLARLDTALRGVAVDA